MSQALRASVRKVTCRSRIPGSAYYVLISECLVNIFDKTQVKSQV